MNISIIIPAHNEAKYIADCLYSFIQQTRKPDEVIVVDDNSSDDTFKIAAGFAKDHSWIKVYQRKSSNEHIPGKKVIDTFNYGFQYISEEYDIVGKFDADIYLPENYFEQMHNHFQANWLLGMCSGLLYIKKNGKWVYENIAKKSHVRGPIKLYYRQVFELMNGLRPGVGWDTVDVLLCKYHDFHVLTDNTLQVRHLRPTGHGYSSTNFKLKGEALYKMRYGLPLAKIALLKMALQAKNPVLYIQGILGYLSAFLKNTERFVTKEEGKFIRKLRWQGVFKRLKS